MDDSMATVIWSKVQREGDAFLSVSLSLSCVSVCVSVCGKMDD